MPDSLIGFLKGLIGSTETVIAIPRWVVLFQAALLGLVSTSCFLFGLAAGHLANVPAVVKIAQVPCGVSGSVETLTGRQPSADAGAVVLFLPIDAKPIQRIDPETLHPDNFRALANPAIDALLLMGGAVCRTDRAGKFQMAIDGPSRYVVVFVSKTANAKKEKLLSKADTAALARCFLPIEALYSGKAIQFRTIDCRTSSVEVDPVRFE